MANIGSKDWVIYRKAWKRWGGEAQVRQLFEEFGELTQALNRHVNGRASTHAVITEIADVEIMLAQVKYMMNFDDELIKKAKEAKLYRLQKRLDLGN